MENLGTILGIWAHPDDEAYLAGGLMATATAAGSRVVCVTATRGELAGDPDQRTAELHECLNILGVTEHHWLGFRDGRCSRVPPSVATARLDQIIARVRPDTIVSFGPDGNTGHPDHQAVARWAEAVTPPGTRLLQTAVPDGWARRWKAVNECFGVFEPGFPVTSPEDELAVHLTLEPPTLDRKVRALAAQATQTAALIAAMGADYADWVAEEAFIKPRGRS